MKRAISSVGAVLFLVPSFLPATTINVPSQHATVQLAVNAAAASGDEIVIAPGTYVGGVLVNQKSVTIRGSDPGNRPVLVLSQVGTPPGGGHAQAGMNISGDGVTVNAQDLVLIPNPASVPNRLIQSSTNTAAATITVNMSNLLLTGNNGSNAPSVTNPFDTATAIGTTTTGDHFYLVNLAFGAGLFDATGIYTMTNVVSIGAGRDSVVAYPNGGTQTGGSLTASGVQIARASRNPLQWGDGTVPGTNFIVTGTRANPGMLIVNNTGDMSAAGISFINSAATIAIDHLAYLNNSETFYLPGSANSISVTDSLFANTPAAFDALAVVEATGAASPVSVTNSTFFSNGNIASFTGGLWLQATAPTYTVQNNVFAGTSGSNQGGVVYTTGTGAQTTLNNNALVLSGPHALAQAQFASGAPAATQTGNVFGDVNFNSTSVTALADLATAFDVQASFLTGAGAGGTDISGWGDLNAVAEPAAAGDWQMYQ